MENNVNYSIERKALYEMIADKLELFILNDTSKISQKLPSEQYLADSFGVSRPVIREALKILKERGLISSHQGSASVISDYSTEHFSKTMRRMAHMKNITPREIYQLRAHLEILSAKLAAENASDDEVEALKKINALIRENAGDVGARAEYDVEFHKTVAKMSGNALLCAIMESISDLLLPIFIEAQDESTDREGIALHDAILDAIEKHDAERAADLMRTHLMISARNYEVFGKEAENGRS